MIILKKFRLYSPHIPHLVSSKYLGIVEIECVIIVEVRLDGVEVEEDIIKLLEQEEAGGHTLAAGDGVTLGGTPAHQLEVLLGNLQVLPLEHSTESVTNTMTDDMT